MNAITCRLSTSPAAVLLSEYLSTFPNGRELLSTLLNQNVDIWMLAVSPDQGQQLSAFLAQRFDLNAEEMSRFKAIPVATETVWARDWAPLFSYSTSNPNDVGLLDFHYYPDRTVDDAVAQGLADYFKLGLNYLGLKGVFPNLNYKVLPVDVELEGGNVMCTDRNCFVTEEVIKRYRDNYGEIMEPQTILDRLEANLDQKF